MDYYDTNSSSNSAAMTDPADEPPPPILLTLPQRQELGRRGLVGARNLLKQVENIDAGKDLRSFQN